MSTRGAKWMFSATDIANFLACQHLTTLDRAEAAGEIARPIFIDPSSELLAKLGLEHELAYLRHLADDQHVEIVEIPTDLTWPDAVARTLDALRRGAGAVHQATFQDGQWGGRADFLIRVEKASALGAWSYEVVETKLARSAKARALIQLCFYSDLLSGIQGIEPEWMHVVLGGGARPERFPVRHYIAYFRNVSREFQEAWRGVEHTYPEPTEHCDVCSWFPVCDARRRRDDHLSLVAGITRNQRKALVERDVATVERLARLPLPVRPKIERIGDAALLHVREQARLQVKGREEGRLVYELLEPAEAGKGLAGLPLPSPGDIFLDFEGDPFAFEQGLEYLIGTVTISQESDAQPAYEALWSFEHTREKKAFEEFIAGVMERRRRYPDMHIFHYAPYEPTAIKRLAGRHATCVEEVDQLLRAGAFVDLYHIVRQGLRASVESYSIKQMEPLYGFTRAVPLRDAIFAQQAFEAVLALGTRREDITELLQTIEVYNRDDCLSALRLQEWLEERRRELEAKTGTALPRPEVRPGEPSEDLAAHLQQVAAIMDRLVAGFPADESEWTDEQRARWLLAQELEWHRREEKSAWWEYFRLCELSDDELEEDKNALGGLVYLGEVGRVTRSVVHRYQFPPQDHAIDRALEVHDPRTRKRAGEVVNINDRDRTIDLKRGTSSTIVHPTALIPFEIVNSRVLRDSLLRFGARVAEHGISGPGPFQAARDLLLRRPPRTGGGTPGPLIYVNEDLTEAANRLVLSLQASTLPVQGPPGSGKTYTGARMVVELVRHGRRVGLTAVSHKVISNLLREVCRAARETRVALRAVQKAKDEDGCEDPMVTQVDTNENVLGALARGVAQVAAGTAWLWAREEMANSVDVLLVDEAGQMSLANALAVSQAASSLVLLGDPQQLDQPQRGVHPPGADVSALAHLLQEHATIGADQGLFLAETWRLHPDVCAFTSELFYDCRLGSRPENQKQRLNTQGFLDGTGLRYIPVEHSGNQNEAPEEVAKVTEVVDGLLRDRATWTNKKDETVTLKLEDILIVAPYNAQVSALAQSLPAGARVGTVDKFQGQEAPLVIYSMTTSTPEDAPRGMEFLYSLNRVNVAISRARCVAVVVARPALFQVRCKTPRQMELANAFCRYLEMARMA
jgi:predicted RecB family nuclease